MKMLNRIFLVLFVNCALVLLLTSCGDDDDSEGFSIIGSWTLTQELTEGCNDPADNEIENEVCTSSDCETVTFDADGGFTVVEIDNGVTTSFSGTYTITGNTISVVYTVNGVTDDDRATFTVNGNTLVLVFDEDSDGCVETDTYIRI